MVVAVCVDVEGSGDDDPALNEPGQLVDLARVVAPVGHRDHNDRSDRAVDAV